MKILSRYILKEYLANLLLGLLIFTFVLLLDHLFELIDLLLNKGVGIWFTLQLLGLLLPSSLSLTLPMSNLLSSLLTYGTFSETNQIVAMRASGLVAWSYVRAPLAAALVCVLFLIPFNTIWAPHAHSKFRELYIRILQRNPLVRIDEKTFSDIGDYHLYVEKKDRKTSEMKGLTIYKTPASGAPLRIFAERGKAAVDPERGLALYLEDGDIEQIDPAKPNQWFYTAFKTYFMVIPFQIEKQNATRTLEEMDDPELHRQITDLKSKGLPYPLFSTQLHLRWALAVTPLLFAILGIPLAIRIQRGGRSIGFGISLMVIALYYALLMGGTGAAQRGVWPPAFALWLGNVLVLIAGVVCTWRFLKQ